LPSSSFATAASSFSNASSLAVVTFALPRTERREPWRSDVSYADRAVARCKAALPRPRDKVLAGFFAERSDMASRWMASKSLADVLVFAAAPRRNAEPYERRADIAVAE
jgi:hypothetical protein